MISVIIPHLEQEAFLERCLKTIRAQQATKDPFEVIVVDNGSRRPPAELCARYDAQLLVEKTPGPGPARNRGVAQAEGDILAFIDSDCTADPGWLCEIERCFAENEGVAVIGGDVRIAIEDRSRPTWLESYESIYAYRMKEYIARQGFTGTGNLAVRASVFRAVGKFGGIDIAEDRDWGQRALAMGYATHYRPQMIVFHPARKSFGEIAEKWRRHTMHDLAAYKALKAWWPRWLLRTIAVAASPVAEIPRIALSDRVSGLRQRLLAFYGVLNVRLYRAGFMVTVALGSAEPDSARRWNRA